MVVRTAFLGVLLAVATAASAQTVVDSFERLPEVVKKGNVIMDSTRLFGLPGGWIGFAVDGAINGQKLVFARSVKF